VSYCCSSKRNNNLQHCLSLSPCTGQSLDGKTSFYLARAKQSNQPGSLQRPQDNSFLTQETYHCSCGPEDFSKELPDALTQQRAKDSRVSGKARGNSRKRGCLAQFKVTRLYCWPDVAQLSLRHAAHTDAAGNAAHGDVITAQGVKHMYAPALSAEMKDWVRTKLLSGVPTRQILKEHWKNVWPKLNAGTADRDCFLVSQDIRNIHSKLAQLSWKLHQNEAQSVRLIAQQHARNIFIYQEQHSSQPSQPAMPAQPPPSDQHSQPAVHAEPSPTDHPPEPADALQQPVLVEHSAQPADPPQQPQQLQKFVMGMAPDSMLANLLKHGHNNALLLDATFGTNHMKLPLYTGLVMDEYNNGLPGFMTLCQGTAQADISQWLSALLKMLRQHNPDWMCSCVMVDDALAEINAIRYRHNIVVCSSVKNESMYPVCSLSCALCIAVCHSHPCFAQVCSPYGSQSIS